MTELLYAEIGARIRLAREEACLTQYELADLLSVTRPSVQMIERGSQRIPVHRIMQIAKATGANPRWLIFGR